MPRSSGARLAVPLLLAIVVIPALITVGLGEPAAAVDGCRSTPNGIVCVYNGRAYSQAATWRLKAPPRPPPLRYLATKGNSCWYWSRYLPGFDSWNSAYDQSIIFTRWRLPECGSKPAVVVFVDAAQRAWAVFRSFPLDPPTFNLTPTVGITNLASRLHLAPPRNFAHSETLPDGRRLEVEATVATVLTEWSDGTPTAGYPVATATGDPGAVRHTYRLKTCPADYRASHLDGPKCHPAFDRYPVTVTYRWQGRYRAGGGWITLGAIDRPARIRYDVDEVLGILQP